jgi:hypothetical protein
MFESIDILNGFAGKGGEGAVAKKRGKFDASILTTYNAYLPFYENVILKRLVASGCQHNILFADAKNLAISLASPSGRPRLAGRDYTLVPMNAAGAFHPKIALLVGKNRARVFVGSHNATLSGFGHNRELTTQIDFDNEPEDPNVSVFHAVWTFLEAWLEHQKERLPPTLMDAVQRVAMSFAPWLRQQVTQEGEVLFFGALPDGDSLWRRIRPFLPGQVDRVTVLGPFFDRDGSFLSTLSQELQPESIVVGIEPARVKLCRLDNLPEKIYFHDTTDLGARKGYLHAKALWIEGKLGEAVLITGSANPSRPAWTAEPSQRNAEAVVLHRGVDIHKLAEKLGLLSIHTLPVLDSTVLEIVLQRSADSLETTVNSFHQITLVAEARTDGLFIPYPGMKVEQVSLSRVTCQEQVAPIEITDYSCQSDGILIPLTHEQVSAAIFSEIHLKNGRLIISFVHHPAAIARLTRTSSQQRFRDALDGLSSESPDLPTVIRLANSLIFGEEDFAEKTKKSISSRTRVDEKETEEELGPLSVPVGETKHHQKRIRDLRGSDLSYVIDILIHRLGIGLSEAAEQLEEQGPSEEELAGTEEELKPVPTALPPIDLAKTCQGKVRTLVTRMSKQIEKADTKGPNAHKVIGQLLAVLAVLREIGAQNQRLAQFTGGKSLVPQDQQRRLLESCLANLFGRKKRLFDVAEQLFTDDPENDLARLLGLLIWLAWDSGLDPRAAQVTNKWDRDAYRESLLDMAKLLELASISGKYELAFEEAHRSAWRTCKEGSKGSASQWVVQFKRWSEALCRLNSAEGKFRVGVVPEPGDLAIVITEKRPKLRLVLNIEAGKVRMVEFGEKNNEISYTRDSIKAVHMPAFSP